MTRDRDTQGGGAFGGITSNRPSIGGLPSDFLNNSINASPMFTTNNAASGTRHGTE